jgi:hypothetical protein
MDRYMDELVKSDRQWYFQRRIDITNMNDQFVP